ncbi:hypothetical protein ACWV26_11135 [Rummeliibacillus sp. JY-2-4R]
MDNEWAFMVDVTEHLRKTMEEADTHIQKETRDGEEYVTLKYKDYKRLLEFYLNEHSTDIRF